MDPRLPTLNPGPEAAPLAGAGNAVSLCREGPQGSNRQLQPWSPQITRQRPPTGGFDMIGPCCSQLGPCGTCGRIITEGGASCSELTLWHRLRLVAPWGLSRPCVYSTFVALAGPRVPLAPAMGFVAPAAACPPGAHPILFYQ